MPCLLNIWGVMLFLRLTWVMGQCGIGKFQVGLLHLSLRCLLCAMLQFFLKAPSSDNHYHSQAIYKAYFP